MIEQPPAWSWRTPASAPRLPAIAGLEGVTPDWAWGASDGAGVKVAVIDSGIDNDHPEIAGRVAGCASFRVDGAGEVRRSDARHGDAFGHGTACAGIIRRQAPACALYSVRVLGPRLSGKGAACAAGLRWAIEQGMRVVNLSLGTTRHDYAGLFYELADLAYFKNVVLVTAANNLPVASYPSLFASVLSVACHDGRDPDEFYYNPAPPVEFLAPGVDIAVAWPGRGRLLVTGNSFAAPHITGLVARILGKHPDLTPFQVKTILRATARNARHQAAPPAP